MIPLSQLIKQKMKDLDISGAELGRRLNGVTGQAIGYYIANKQVPSLEFAIQWKKAFNENLIEQMFAENGLPMAQENIEVYEKVDLLRDLVSSQKETIIHLQAKIKTLEKSPNLANTGKKPRRS